MTTFEELDQACKCLAPILADRKVRGAGVVGGSLDLVLFFEERPHEALHCLRIASGPPQRARVLLEAVRLRKKDYLEGESSRHLQQAVVGSRIVGLALAPGERTILLDLRTEAGVPYRLLVECFGPRGNWFLLDGFDKILTEAYRPGGGRAGLVPGAIYLPPGAGRSQEHAPAAVPSQPWVWLEKRATHYAALDARALFTKRFGALTRALRREEKALRSKKAGLLQRQTAEAGAEDLRREGELLLACPDPRRRGLDRIVVQDWYAQGAERELSLDNRLSISDNAERRFRRAKRLLEGARHTAALLSSCEASLERVEETQARLAQLEPLEDLEALAPIEEEIAAWFRPGGSKGSQKVRKKEVRLPYRKFRSIEGYPILVGRTNRDNDRLSMSIARGNDWWMHIGQGYGGSHVVIRVPRGKSPALETLLDAAHLAVYFSKARGRGEAEVIYTQRKHLRKRKGAKAGAVEVTRSKPLQIRIEADRMARLLEGAEDGT